jgi:hypothetical protein
MGSDVVIALIFAGTVVLTSITSVTLAWHRARRRALRAEAAPPSTAADGQRLCRVEQSVEALVLEIERVAESQRYTARLLTEMHEQMRRRQLPERSSVPGRVITPH